MSNKKKETKKKPDKKLIIQKPRPEEIKIKALTGCIEYLNQLDKQERESIIRSLITYFNISIDELDDYGKNV